MEVGGQLHAPAALQWEKRTTLKDWTGRWVTRYF